VTDVFISYAREDRKFVQRLHDALSNDGHKAWVDWEGIPASAKWMAEVRAAIDEADCFCFVVSPDSVESPVCREEAAHAAASNKRMLPLLHRAVSDGLVPETVAAHNWIEFDEKADFDRAFATLVKALETEPEHLRTHTRLLVRAKEWDTRTRDRSYLLRGQDLIQAESWLGACQGKEPAPTQLQTAYLLDSRKAASRRQRTTIGAVAVALVLSLVLSAVAVIQRGEAQDAQTRAEEQRAAAEEQARIANSRALAIRSVANLDSQLDVGMLLAVEAERLASTPESDNALHVAAQRGRLIDAILRGHTDAVWDVAFSPDGRLLASGSEDGSVIVWDAATGEPIGEPLIGHDGPVNSVAFDPKGEMLASAGSDGTVVRWDPLTGEQIGEPVQAHGAPIWRLAFGPDGRVLASASADGSIGMMDPQAGEMIGALHGRDGQVFDAVFAPDGRTLASGGEDGDIQLWDVASGEPVGAPIHAHPGGVFSLDFSDDGRSLVSGGLDGTMSIWDPATGTRVMGPLGSNVRMVDLSPDGRLLASGEADGTVVLWDVSTGEQIGEPLRGHSSTVNPVVFSPDGRRLASGSADSTVVLWNAPATYLLSGDVVLAVAASPDGGLLATGSEGGTIALWT